MIVLYLLAIAIYGATLGFSAPFFFLAPGKKTWVDWTVLLFPVINTGVLVWQLTKIARIWKRSEGL